jgi:hypothetical protein
VSKRHQANRRKSYGRRQHELQERAHRARQPQPDDHALDDVGPGSMVDRFSFLDPRTPRLHYLAGD